SRDLAPLVKRGSKIPNHFRTDAELIQSTKHEMEPNLGGRVLYECPSPQNERDTLPVRLNESSVLREHKNGRRPEAANAREVRENLVEPGNHQRADPCG